MLGKHYTTELHPSPIHASFKANTGSGFLYSTMFGWLALCHMVLNPPAREGWKCGLPMCAGGAYSAVNMLHCVSVYLSAKFLEGHCNISVEGEMWSPSPQSLSKRKWCLIKVGEHQADTRKGFFTLGSHIWEWGIDERRLLPWKIHLLDKCSTSELYPQFSGSSFEIPLNARMLPQMQGAQSLQSWSIRTSLKLTLFWVLSVRRTKQNYRHKLDTGPRKGLLYKYLQLPQ
jgi:hypothetical protein